MVCIKIFYWEFFFSGNGASVYMRMSELLEFSCGKYK